MQIFIHRGGQQYGPYALEDAKAHLAAGQLQPDDLAWHEGAADWVPLSQLLGAPPAPPSMPPAPTRAVAATVPKTIASDDAIKKMRKSAGLRTMGYGGLWLVGGLGATLYSYEEAAPGGGSYFFWGAILVGVIQFVKGLIIYVKA